MSQTVIHILLVEDNLEDARLLREMLTESGAHKFNLTHVTLLSDAVQRLANGDIDAILLDLGLPDAHGLDTVLKIRAARPDIAIVVLTGSDDEEIAV